VAASDQLQIKLGFKDSPTTGDDFINLNFLAQPATPNTIGYGYWILGGGYQEGQPYLDANNRLVRDLTFTLSIEGSSRDDAIARFRNLKRFISRTRSYFAQFGGNPPARSDAKGHQGQAAVLTMQAPSATNELYWDVVGGPDPVLPSIAGKLTKTSFDNVQVTFTVDAWARGARVVLENLIDTGDFANPYSITGFNNNLRGGWTYPNTTDWTLDTSRSKYGIKALKWNASSSTTLTSNEPAEVTLGDVIVPSIWIYFLDPTITGTLTVKLQKFSSAAWSDAGVTVASITGAVTAGVWTRYDGAAYTVASGVSKVRLAIVSPTGGVHYFGGAAMWKNPTGNAVPTEYLGAGRTVGMPQCNVYNVQGDVPSPIMMRVMTGVGAEAKNFIAGGMAQDLGTISNRLEYPVFGMDMRPAATATGSTVIFGGSLPTEQTGSGSTSTANVTNTLVGLLDRRPRIYRAFLIYALNDAVTVSSVKLSASLGFSGNAESKTFNVVLPSTYTGTGTIAAGNFRAYDLGDFQLSRQGINWEENFQTWVNASAFVTITHTSSANRHCSIAGVILLPADQFTSINANTSLNAGGANSGVDIYNEGTAPRVAVQSATLGSGSTQNVPVELASWDSSASFTGGDLYLEPSDYGDNTGPTKAMRYEVLLFQAYDSTTKLYTFSASDTKAVSVSYTPRYSSAVR
jgi:hypothetical protein